MENKTLLDKFTAIANSRKAEIIELQHIYLLKQIQNELVQDEFNAVSDKVLAEHPYYATKECNRSRSGNNIKVGDRILSHYDDWLMSEPDFDEYNGVFCREAFYEAGLTDSEGLYTEETNTENQLREVKDKLVRLSVEILPYDFPNKSLLEDAIDYKGYNSYQTREKLFELVMQLR